MGDLKEDRSVDPMEARLVGRRVGLKADHSGGHLEDLREGRLEGPKVGHSEDLMEVQKGQAVTKVASLLSERLVLLGPVQVVQPVVKKEAMEQAQIGLE